MYFVRSTFCLNLVTWKLLQLTYDYWSVIFDANDISFVSLLLFFIYWSFTNCYGYFRWLDFALHLFFMFWNYYIFNNGDFYFICIFYLPKHYKYFKMLSFFLLSLHCKENAKKMKIKYISENSRTSSFYSNPFFPISTCSQLWSSSPRSLAEHCFILNLFHVPPPPWLIILIPELILYSLFFLSDHLQLFLTSILHFLVFIFQQILQIIVTVLRLWFYWLCCHILQFLQYLSDIILCQFLLVHL